MSSPDPSTSALQILKALLYSGTLQDLPPDHLQDPVFAELYQALAEIRRFALAIGSGDLSESLSTKGYLVGALKHLHANLPRLSRQSNLIAPGDANQRTGFVGEFSQALNTMTEHLRQSRRDLQALQELSEHIVESLAEGVTLDDCDGRIVLVNRAAAEMFGCPAEQMTGKLWSDFLQPDEFRFVQAAHARRVAGQSDRYELRIPRGDGASLTVLVSGAPRFEAGQFKGTIAVLADITERQQQQAAVRASDQRYRLLAENATDVIWTMDLNLRYTYVSPSVLALRGYTPEQVMQQTIEQAVCAGSLPTIRERIRMALELAAHNSAPPASFVEVEQPCRDGSTVWTEVAGSLLRDEQGQAIGLVGVSRDITARKRLEEENRRLLQETLRLATTDPLTGCFNRQHFQDLAADEIARAYRYQHPLSLLLFDMDQFKRVNDTYGHLVGDEILQRLADLCRATIRHTDIVGRFGGDEFTILLPETPVAASLAGTRDAQAVAERLCRQIAQAPLATEAGVMNVTISLGIAELREIAGATGAPRDPGEVFKILLRHADRALYSAKEGGGNQVRLYRKTRPDGDL